jgi:hypothetical protein
MRRVLPGPYTIATDGPGRWRLCAAPPSGSVILVRGLRGPAGEEPAPLDGARATAVTLDWPAGGGVDIDLALPQAVFGATAAEVRVHAFPADLYRVLPLAHFDARARAFWRRIFLLVRLPGGRFLLQAAARRARASR